MLKKIVSFSTLLLVLTTLTVLAFERSSRLHALNELDVEKNKAILLRTNKCRGCYLAHAKLSGADLAYADLRMANLVGTTFIRATLYGADLSGAKIAGANFSGAQWIDGSICQTGSIGRCIKPVQ
ncbi:pentapeptide repeat-containing protein [bacterium]|nr:pentapeptide repeat-containing protein [bacterium]